MGPSYGTLPRSRSISPQDRARSCSISHSGPSHSSSPWSFHDRIARRTEPRYQPQANQRSITTPGKDRSTCWWNSFRHSTHNTASGQSHPAQPLGNSMSAIIAAMRAASPMRSPGLPTQGFDDVITQHHGVGGPGDAYGTRTRHCGRIIGIHAVSHEDDLMHVYAENPRQFLHRE